MEGLNKLFNKDMSISEARTALYVASEGKDETEKKQIFDAYETILPEIVKNDMAKNHDYLV